MAQELLKPISMKIAQVAPLYESVPPQTYGGTERVVSHLTEELVRQGHEVTLFASGDSVTQAKLIPIVEKSLRLNPKVWDPFPVNVLQVEAVLKHRSEFDVVHFHTDYFHFPSSRVAGMAQLTTLHGRLDIPELAPLYREFNDMPVVSISNSQRSPLPFCNWAGTVLHGLPPGLFSFKKDTDGYLAFLGRISPEKRADRAIEIANRCGMRLKIAAKIDKVDREYYEEKIAPMIAASPNVEFIGEIGEFQKQEFLGKASALLFPIDWPEPFGLVMIEAMACGTPVIAFKNGSIPEVISHGKNGFIVESVDEAVSAVKILDCVSREDCRKEFESRFTAQRMANDYVELYERVKADRQNRTLGRRRRHYSGQQSVLRAGQLFEEHAASASAQAAG